MDIVTPIEDSETQTDLSNYLAFNLVKNKVERIETEDVSILNGGEK